MSFYGGSRLPFARPGNSPNPSLQLAGATQAAADLSCSLNKALRPWLPCSSQAPFRPRQTFLQLQQVPEAVAVSFYGGSRLPFASLENSPNLSLQLPGATPAAADLSCSSNKALRPWQCPFMEVQGCRLPGLETPQTPNPLVGHFVRCWRLALPSKNISFGKNIWFSGKTTELKDSIKRHLSQLLGRSERVSI